MILILSWTAGSPALAASGPWPVLRVVDGDTVLVLIQGKKEKIRLLNVDTPESVHPDTSRNTDLGRAAAAYAKKRLSGRQVHLEFENKKRGRYGRLLAYVIIDGENFNIELVRLGWSPYYTKYGNSPGLHARFLEAQAEARQAKQGIWADAPAKTAADRYDAVTALGPVHGNTVSKVFHMPGCRWYDCKHCTLVFPTPRKAREAGFRPGACCAAP